MNQLKSILFIVFLLSGYLVNSQKFNPPFFVFEDGLWNARSDSPEYWSDLVKKVGFDGVELIGLDRVNGLLPELKRNNLKLFTLYIKIEIDKEEPYDPRLMEYIKKLKDTGLHLWVHVHSERYSCSDTSGDEDCVRIISELADYASDYGVKIAFYPHTNFWLEKVSDAVRLTEKIKMPNVGAVFNLCHFLKTDEPHNLKQTLKTAMPYLFLVSVNGADGGPDTNDMGWEQLIQPLGSGSYDVLKVLKILKEQGYNKPVGLQCYNIKGEPEIFLEQSMNTWKKYIKEVNQ